MEKPGYGAEIVRTINGLPYEAVIQTGEIARQLAAQFSIPFTKAKAATNVKLKRMADEGKIERLQKGMYCRTRQTVFGQVAPNLDKMMVKLLTVRDGGRIGYESGASLFNKLGLTTLIPREIEITTNSFDMGLPDGCHVRPRKPLMVVSNENWRYLQFIDAVRALPNMHIDAANPEQILRQFASKQQLEPLTVIITARRYSSPKTVLRLVDLFMEA